jgi:hypothetical protein
VCPPGQGCVLRWLTAHGQRRRHCIVTQQLAGDARTVGLIGRWEQGMGRHSCIQALTAG